jgi:hypothetical protein
MKISAAHSLVLTAGILLLGGLLGGQRQQSLKRLRATHHRLEVRAAELGVQASTRLALPSSKRVRDSAALKSRSVLASVVSLAREMDTRRSYSTLADGGFQSRITDLNQRLLALDPADLQGIIGSLFLEKNLTPETQVNFIGSALMILCDVRPAEAAALYAESASLLGSLPLGKHVISKILGRWAEQNPQAAQDWIRDHPGGVAGLSEADAQRILLSGTLKTSPALAVSLLQEMGGQESSHGLRTLVSQADTLAQRSALLVALRERGGEQQLRESLGLMAQNLRGETFATVESWLATASFSPAEKAQFAAGLTYASTQQDTGRWIDWLSATLPSAQLRGKVDSLIGEWTQQDYLAAGQWLAASAAGPAKNAAIATYAGTVASYEPQTAVQWALTLAPGPERQATLTTILRNWPKRDAEAAARFAQENGLTSPP